MEQRLYELNEARKQSVWQIHAETPGNVNDIQSEGGKSKH